MSVSFIYQNMTFYYRIDSVNRALPVHGEAQSMEHMYEQIKQRLKQYYRNRPVKTCKTCDATLQLRENEGDHCEQHQYDN